MVGALEKRTKKGVWGSMNTYAASSISNHKHKRAALGKIGGRAFIVECRQADAVLLQAIRQRPGIGKLQAGRNEQPYLLRQRAGEDLRRGGSGGVESDEGKRGQGRWLEGRCGAVRRGVDPVGHVVWWWGEGL